MDKSEDATVVILTRISSLGTTESIDGENTVLIRLAATHTITGPPNGSPAIWPYPSYGKILDCVNSIQLWFRYISIRRWKSIGSFVSTETCQYGLSKRCHSNRVPTPFNPKFRHYITGRADSRQATKQNHDDCIDEANLQNYDAGRSVTCTRICKVVVDDGYRWFADQIAGCDLLKTGVVTCRSMKLKRAITL